MSATENDLDLLESYLDDELGGAELESLRKRLSSDPSLSAAMDELLGQRNVRQLFFASCEPDAMSVERLIRSARQGATRQIVWGERNRKLRFVSGIAACLAVGFFVGRGSSNDADPTINPLSQGQQLVIGSMPIRTGMQVSLPQATPSAQPSPQVAPQLAQNVEEVIFDGPRTNRDFNISRINPNMIAPKMAGYQVKLVDPSTGNVIRQFDSPEQFNKFVSEQTPAASQPGALRFPGN